jgi:hypothetical protein
MALAVILVFSVGHTLKGEKILKENSVPCKLVPVPRQFSSDCGVCLRIEAADKERAAALFAASKMEYEAMRDL